MTSKAMKKRIKGRRNCGIPVDRLSTLPDSLISHILSFLPTKEAVRTYILSKSWINLWTSITNLDFDDGFRDDTFWYEDFSEVSLQPLEICKTKFVCFLFHVFTRLTSPSIRKFSFNCAIGDDNSCFTSCMHYACRKGVEELDVTIYCDNLSFTEHGEYVNFPGNNLSWNTLVTLKLSDFVMLAFSMLTSTVAFPKLKAVHLDNVCYENGDSLPNFLSCCPLLTDFVVTDRIMLHNVSTIAIVSSSLVNLTVKLGSERGSWGCHLKIIAPALRFLDLCDETSTCWKFSFENLSLLEAASVRFYPFGNNKLGHVLGMLKAIANVSRLKISGDIMEVLHDAPDLEFKFPNLRTLEVSYPKQYWRGLHRLLDSLDNDKLIELKTSCLDN